MKQETLLKEPQAELYYLPEFSTLHFKLIGRLPLDEFKKYCNFLLDQIIEKEVTSYIYDQTQTQGATSMEGRAWLIVNWLPRLKENVKSTNFKILGVSQEKTGLKKIVADYLQSTFNKLTPFRVEVYHNLDQALQSLEKEQNL